MQHGYELQAEQTQIQEVFRYLLESKFQNLRQLFEDKPKTISKQLSMILQKDDSSNADWFRLKIYSLFCDAGQKVKNFNYFFPQMIEIGKDIKKFLNKHKKYESDVSKNKTALICEIILAKDEEIEIQQFRNIINAENQDIQFSKIIHLRLASQFTSSAYIFDRRKTSEAVIIIDDIHQRKAILLQIKISYEKDGAIILGGCYKDHNHKIVEKGFQMNQQDKKLYQQSLNKDIKILFAEDCFVVSDPERIVVISFIPIREATTMNQKSANFIKDTYTLRIVVKSYKPGYQKLINKEMGDGSRNLNIFQLKFSKELFEKEQQAQQK